MAENDHDDPPGRRSLFGSPALKRNKAKGQEQPKQRYVGPFHERGVLPNGEEYRLTTYRPVIDAPTTHEQTEQDSSGEEDSHTLALMRSLKNASNRIKEQKALAKAIYLSSAFIASALVLSALLDSCNGRYALVNESGSGAYQIDSWTGEVWYLYRDRPKRLVVEP